MTNVKTKGFELTGFKELEKSLLALADMGSDKDAFDAMNFGIRKALQPVLKKAQQLAPYDPESEGRHLRDEIKIQIPKSPTKVMQREGRAAFGHVIVSGKKKAPDLIPQKAIAAEFGLDGSRQRGETPFLRPALYSKTGEIFSILKTEIGKAIERKAKKIAKQNKVK